MCARETYLTTGAMAVNCIHYSVGDVFVAVIAVNLGETDELPLESSVAVLVLQSVDAVCRDENVGAPRNSMSSYQT